MAKARAKGRTLKRGSDLTREENAGRKKRVISEKTGRRRKGDGRGAKDGLPPQRSRGGWKTRNNKQSGQKTRLGERNKDLGITRKKLGGGGGEMVMP